MRFWWYHPDELSLKKHHTRFDLAFLANTFSNDTRCTCLSSNNLIGLTLSFLKKKLFCSDFSMPSLSSFFFFKLLHISSKHSWRCLSLLLFSYVFQCKSSFLSSVPSAWFVFSFFEWSFAWLTKLDVCVWHLLSFWSVRTTPVYFFTFLYS